MNNYINHFLQEPYGMIFISIFIFLNGLCLGSFLNVVIWRVPQGLSINKPRSFCPKCKHQITALENIPVLSWILLKGKCHKCKLPISIRYPTVELATAVLMLISWLTIIFNQQQPSQFIRIAIFVFWAIAFSMIDIDTKTVPTTAIYIAIFTMLLVVVIPESTTHNSFISNMLFEKLSAFINPEQIILKQVFTSILGMFVGVGIIAIVNIICKAPFLKITEFGGGDVKYVAFIGLTIGIQNILPCLLTTAILGVIFAFTLKNKSQEIPLVPFFSISAFMLILADFF